MPPYQKLGRFGLRTAFFGAALLGIGFTMIAPYFRSPPNDVSQAQLDRLVAQIEPGMTEAEVSDIFGFSPRELGLDEDEDPTWTFCVTELKATRHRGTTFYVGKFSNGRLVGGGLWSLL